MLISFKLRLLSVSFAIISDYLRLWPFLLAPPQSAEGETRLSVCYKDNKFRNIGHLTSDNLVSSSCCPELVSFYSGITYCL